MNESETPSPSLGRRAVALLVLLVAGWVLLHLVIHIAVAIASTIVIVVAVLALIWALRVVL
jgi:uncharacterized membrane protein